MSDNNDSDSEDITTQTCLAAVAGTLTVADCAQKLYAPILVDFQNSGNKNSAEGNMWDLWYSIIDVAMESEPEKQECLVEVVRTLEGLPAPMFNGKAFQVWGQSWQELPVFGPAIRERMEVVPQQSSYWVNYHAFLARLTTARIINCSLLALWAFRSSLEDPSVEDITQARVSSSGLEAVAVWIQYAGEALRTRSKIGLTYGDRVGMPGGEFKDTRDWKGYNEERWGVWLERLRLAGGAAGLPERIKVLIAECVESMEKL